MRLKDWEICLYNLDSVLNPRFSFWYGVDPLAEKFPGFSPSNYCLNNPVMLVDPDGRDVASPIYGTDGRFLGTDDQGLKGKPIIMPEENFTQGMKHEDAIKRDLAPKGGMQYLQAISDYTNYILFYKHFNNLQKRPDYDGVVDDWEARKWWNENSGSPLYVDISQLSLAPLTTASFNNADNTRLQFNFFTNFKSNKRTARVHGTLTMRLKNSTTGEVGLFTDDNGFFDTYDFNGDGRLIRDVTTWGARQVVGEGTGYGFIPYGRNPRVPVKK